LLHGLMSFRPFVFRIGVHDDPDRALVP